MSTARGMTWDNLFSHSIYSLHFVLRLCIIHVLIQLGHVHVSDSVVMSVYQWHVPGVEDASS